MIDRLRLDGSAVPRLRRALADRHRTVLAGAVDAKQRGRGALARPEADAGLMELLSVLHVLEPQGLWLDRAMLTYAWSLDDALRSPHGVHWGREWLRPAETSASLKLSMLDWLRYGNDPPFGADFGKRAPLGPEPLWQAEVWTAGNARRMSNDWRQHVYSALATRLEAARARVEGRTSGTLPDPIPGHLGEPLWRNVRPSAMPQRGSAALRKWGEGVARTAVEGLGVGHLILNWGGLWLGAEPAAGERLQLPITRSHAAVNHLVLGGAAERLGLSLLDRALGGPAGELLRALRGLGRWMWHDLAWQQRWRGDVQWGSWDAVLAPLCVNDRPVLRAWAECARASRPAFDAARWACVAHTVAWVDGQSEGPLKIPKTAGKFETSFMTAVQGLLDRNPAKVDEGVAGVLRYYPRTEWTYFEPRTFARPCIPAVALQREALRIGLSIRIADEPPNDPELVSAALPPDAALPWVVWPGVELIANADAPLEWLTLLLGERVGDVEET